MGKLPVKHYIVTICLLALALNGCKHIGGSIPLKKVRRNVSADSSTALARSIDEVSDAHQKSVTDTGADLPKTIDPAQPEDKNTDDTLDTTKTVTLGNLSIDESGLLHGDDVHHDLAPTGRSYSTGSPKGIILHKTAGNSCNRRNNTVSNKAPHLYICRDGRIIVNGSFKEARTAAELGHNDWSLNIEFEAAYEKDKSVCAQRGEKTQGGTSEKNGWGNCYQQMTTEQIIQGRQVIAMLSDKYDIPTTLALPVENELDYIADSTRVLKDQFPSDPNNPNNLTASEMSRGVLPSNWTRFSNDKYYRYYSKSQGRYIYPNWKDHHDDGPSWMELRALGIAGDTAQLSLANARLPGADPRKAIAGNFPSNSAEQGS